MLRILPRVHLGAAPRALLALLVLALGLALARPAASSAPDQEELMRLGHAVNDTSRAAGAIPRLHRILAGDLDSAYVTFTRQMLLQALVTTRASATTIIAEADTLSLRLGNDRQARVLFFGNLAQLFVDRGEQLDRAVDYAKRSLAACPDDQSYAPVRGAVEAILGQAQLKRGDTEAAIAALSRAVTTSADSQTALFLLGQAYVKRGRPDQAIDAYVRSVGVFPGKDSSAVAPLRALYRKRHGSIDGLAARIQVARKASRGRIALDTHRHAGKAPEWKLADLAGKTVRLSDFKGKVIVVDFWGSWCGPCRAELPYFQAIYERYKDRGVVFVGINFEREKTPEARLKRAKDFITSSRYTFPVVIDLDGASVMAYGVDGFPTVYVIDPTGQFRYRNSGFDQGIDAILSAQIESLIE